MELLLLFPIPTPVKLTLVCVYTVPLPSLAHPPPPCPSSPSPTLPQLSKWLPCLQILDRNNRLDHDKEGEGEESVYCRRRMGTTILYNENSLVTGLIDRVAALT